MKKQEGYKRHLMSWAVRLLVAVAGVLLASPAVSSQTPFAYSGDALRYLNTYSINLSTGALIPIPPDEYLQLEFPRSLAVHPSDRFLYLVTSRINPFTEPIRGYSINQSTGALTFIGRWTGVPYALSVTVDPSGRFAYVANSAAAGRPISAYSINPSTGALTYIGFPLQTSQGGVSVTVHPGGRFAYAIVRPDSILTYRIDLGTGALTAIGSPVPAGGAGRVTVDPSGRFAYVPNPSLNRISAFSIDPSTGALTAIGSPVPAGSQPVLVSVDPGGRFVYVANSGSQNISAYSINPSTGALTAIGSPMPTLGRPISMTVDPSGQFVYVGNQFEIVRGNISTYRIDPSTGALTWIGSVPGEPVTLETTTGYINGPIYVDRLYAGIERGTQANPFRTVAWANSAARQGAEIRIRAGSYPEMITFQKPLTLTATGGPVTIGP